KRAVFQPPINDIWSADALNRIYDHASRIQSRGIAGPTKVDLDDELLKNVNFSTGVAGNIGALKNNGKLNWPAALSGRDFENERSHFNQLAADAYRQGSDNNKVDAGVIEDMERYLSSMDQKLTDRVRDLAPEDYMDGKHYINDLRQAIKILKRPD